MVATACIHFLRTVIDRRTRHASLATRSSATVFSSDMPRLRSARWRVHRWNLRRRRHTLRTLASSRYRWRMGSLYLFCDQENTRWPGGYWRRQTLFKGRPTCNKCLERRHSSHVPLLRSRLLHVQPLSLIHSILRVRSNDGWRLVLEVRGHSATVSGENRENKDYLTNDRSHWKNTLKDISSQLFS